MDSDTHTAIIRGWEIITQQLDNNKATPNNKLIDLAFLDKDEKYIRVLSESSS